MPFFCIFSKRWVNKQESSNKLGKAVFYGNNREFRQGTKEEQMTAEGCKRLIENSVICWNYLYLSQLIFNAETCQKIVAKAVAKENKYWLEDGKIDENQGVDVN